MRAGKPSSAVEPLTSLDAVETTVTDVSVRQFVPDHSDDPHFEEPFRHSGWRALRNKTADALEYAGVSSRRIIRFRACGSRCWILKRPTDESKIVLAVEHCHDRFCIPCQKARSARLGAKLLSLCEGKDLRFFTFTLKHRETPLKTQVDRLTRSFRKLRQTAMWKKTQSGGVAVIELKRNNATGCWHPHLHVIAEGSFVSQSEVATAWHKITGDSFIVDVRRVRDGREATRYISKYASKGIDTGSMLTHEQMAEAITALESKRLVQCFGTWSKFRTTDEPTEESWERWITLEELIRQAIAGVTESKRILAILHTQYDLVKFCDTHNLDPPPKPDQTVTPTVP